MYQCLQNITSNLLKVHVTRAVDKSLQSGHVKILFNMARAISCFKGVEDRYSGITVSSLEECCAAQDFSSMLDESIKCWNVNNKRGIWFKVDTKQADWVPILVNKGFDFHHAKPGFVMMYRWLPEHESSNVPSYAHTMVGVGAVVVNKQNQVLVVKEKHFHNPQWKFPGGITEPGENLIPAAIREVKEETNIDAEFDSFLSFRHAHARQFDCSDLYMVLTLKALSEEVCPCPREILAAKWMEIQEFLNSEEVGEFNKLLMKRYLDYKQMNIKIECRNGYNEFYKVHYDTYSAVSREKNKDSS